MARPCRRWATAYRTIKTTLHDQGTDRFSAEEVLGLKGEIWETPSELFEKSSWHLPRQTAKGEPFWRLGGAKPTGVDITLLGFIVAVLVTTRELD